MADFTNAKWIFEPNTHEITSEKVVIVTDPETDYWQRTYYGFRNDNAHSLLLDSKDNFTFTARAEFNYSALFEQCGLVIYLDSENWFKVSIEYENERFSRLGSVVTNMGYSDWASTDIDIAEKIWFRLSRRGPDFLIESSFDGESFKQMRIFHLHKLGETTAAMGHANSPLPAKTSIRFGLYACSPLKSSFTATFSDMQLEPCQWLAHSAEA